MRAVEILCERVDPNRILWGSDFGFGFNDGISYRLPVLLSSRVNPDLHNKILGQNPLRLLGM